jgi:hypothetical protein
MLAVNTKNTKRKRGRPAGRTQDRNLHMRVDAAFLSLVDEWRRHQPDIPPRTEAIRRMVEIVTKGGK